MRMPFVWFLLSMALAFSLSSSLTSSPPRNTRRSDARVSYGTADSAVVSGVVYDSLARSALAGATVQLVSDDVTGAFGRTVMSNTVGAFSFDGVPDGRYMLGFYHPMLDSLGLEPLVRSLTVERQQPVIADLATPALPRFRAIVCGDTPAQSAGAMVVGIVRDARTKAPVAGVTVAGQWLELTIGTQGLNRRTPRRVATTAANGWFAICNAPSPGMMTLTANRGADSTDVIELDVPDTGFLRRELYLGAARTIMVRGPFLAPDSARAVAPDSLAPPPRRVHVGDGVLSGTVVGTVDTRPLGGAVVGIVNGPQTRANLRGEWTLRDAPPGTRTLEVRAVGYYPVRQAVDIVDSAPAVRVALNTLRAVLDTMKVVAAIDRNTGLAGFRERQRSGLGRFLTPDDIARRVPTATSELFRMIPGVYYEGGDQDARILMRGTFEDRCEPTIYINGGAMPGLSALDIDAFVRPREVAGIEIYSASQAPAQFLPALSGCGSIVIWTRR